MAVNRGGKIVGEMADCWADRMAVVRVGLRVDQMIVKMGVKTAG